MQASSRSHHQGYRNLGPTSGGYLPPISSAERGSEGSTRGVEAILRCAAVTVKRGNSPRMLLYRL